MKIRELIVEDKIINITGYNHQAGDLESAADWIGKSMKSLRVEVVDEPIKIFMPQIKEMYNTYDEYPQDSKRTNIILQKLNAGQPEYPIYVARGDKEKFVMEGRHRMVVFWLAGLKTIPVAYVY